MLPSPKRTRRNPSPRAGAFLAACLGLFVTFAWIGPLVRPAIAAPEPPAPAAPPSPGPAPAPDPAPTPAPSPLPDGPQAPPETPARPAAALPDVVAFVRPGCPHCAKAKAWLAQLPTARPGVLVKVRDISEDKTAMSDLEGIAKAAKVAPIALPAFHVRGILVVGWVDEGSTGRRISRILDEYPAETAGVEGAGCPLVPEPEKPPCKEEEGGGRTEVDLPLFGRVSVRDVGLPIFTLAVGLVDGFNPCAMWVLVFLLSILARMHSRPRMLAVAGTFVFVSGAIYFLFMAALLNVFLLVGFARPIQVILGCFALFAGLIHTKDFFAFHKGITLSIPESAKPGIYARVNGILHAPSLLASIVGAAILAILVNMVEMLCTAGLPAVYTSVLSSYHLSRWSYYGYLALYQVTYMLDDAALLAVAVITLSRGKMQERSGRVLKLVSGVIMLLLGVLLLFAPNVLHGGE